MTVRENTEYVGRQGVKATQRGVGSAARDQEHSVMQSVVSNVVARRYLGFFCLLSQGCGELRRTGSRKKLEDRSCEDSKGPRVHPRGNSEIGATSELHLRGRVPDKVAEMPFIATTEIRSSCRVTLLIDYTLGPAIGTNSP